MRINNDIIVYMVDHSDFSIGRPSMVNINKSYMNEIIMDNRLRFNCTPIIGATIAGIHPNEYLF